MTLHGEQLCVVFLGDAGLGLRFDEDNLHLRLVELASDFVSGRRGESGERAYGGSHHAELLEQSLDELVLLVVVLHLGVLLCASNEISEAPSNPKKTTHPHRSEEHTSELQSQ